MFTSLKTSIWLSALMRRAQNAGAFACVLHKGDPDAGAVLLKVRTPDGRAVLYRAMRDMDGARHWSPNGPIPDREADQAIMRERDFDPDMWAVEIEDRQGRHFLTDPVDGE